MGKGTEVDWNDLRYLRVSLQQGSLARAARALRVQHTTVGRRLSALERALGAPLVVRGSDGLRPTPIGAELIPLLDDVERAVGAICAHAGARRSVVRLATPSGFAHLLGGAIAELGKRHPEVSLEILSGSHPVDLRRGDADLALRIGPVEDQDLIARKLGELGWAVYGSRDYVARAGRPSATSELAGHDVIGFEATLSGSPAARWLEEHARGAKVVLRSREMVDMRDACLRGIGLAVLPCVLGDPEPSLERIGADVVARRPIAVVYRRDARLSTAVRTVIRLTADAVATQIV